MNARRYTLEIHHIVGDSVNVDVVKVPKGGRWVSHLKRRGRTLVVVYDRRGWKVRALQYRRAERISVNVHV